MSLPHREQALWFLDQKINTRGMAVDVQSATDTLNFIDGFKEYVNDQITELTNGAATTAKQNDRLLKWLSQHISMPNMQAETVKEALANPALPAGHVARKVLELRQAASKSSTSKIEAMLRRACEDGRARDLFMFCGGRTHRWAGQGIQVHNLPRGDEDLDQDACIADICELKPTPNEIAFFTLVWGDPMSAISKCIRGYFIASKGKDLLCSDFSAIEARVLAWIAGEEKVLAAFRENLDIYTVAATGIYDKPYDQITKDERQIGKVAILALGYQGHVGAWTQMAANYGVHLPEEQTKLIISTWREDNANIVQLWYHTEKIVKAVIRSRKDMMFRGIIWRMRGDFLQCVLPSGSIMHYYKPLISKHKTPWGQEKDMISYMGVNSQTKKWMRIRTYGGKLVENVVQSVARDLLADAMFRVDAAGYNIVMHVHDEIVCEEDEGTPFEPFNKLIAVVPDWAEGLPMKAAGWIGKRYRK